MGFFSNSRERRTGGGGRNHYEDHQTPKQHIRHILILISDGKPNGKGYSGEPARKDLLETKHCLEKRGIHLFAAAIGEDRELIENIYQNGFLNISDLETMPVKLSKLLMAYLR